MNTGPTFWIIIALGAAVLVGVALAYSLISKRARRETKREGINDKHQGGE
jgi:hypothetical protein